MAELKDMVVTIRVKFSLWDAIKFRIAGINQLEETDTKSLIEVSIKDSF